MGKSLLCKDEETLDEKTKEILFSWYFHTCKICTV